MDFFDNRCFRLNKILTCIIGQWPYQSKKETIIISSIYLIMNLSLVIVMITGLVTLDLNFDDILNSVTNIMTCITIGVKLINCILNKKKMKYLLNSFETNWMMMSETEIEIMQECSDSGKIIIVLYAVLVYSSMSLFFITTYTPQVLDIIKPLNESRPRKKVYRTNYYLIDGDKYFYTLLMHEQLGYILNMTTLICVDTMYVKYVEHICGMFSILRYRIENVMKIFDMDFSKCCTSKQNEQITREVSHCIAYHRKAIRCAECVESIYGLALFIELTISMILLSATGYVAAVKLGTFDEFFQMIPFASAQVVHLFYNSLPGQQLINSSEAIGDSVSSAQWYRMPIKAQKLLILLMIRSFHRPCTIQAFGGIFTLSMESFSSGMKTSVSYFTVLLSMTE
ncbi:odorant receptor 13a-like isoform X1 [Leptopilina boulardi]|uniref:odorant receptor 13a-like isoform X1 n=1 Tax=Leptopilina boulardi TaxID=63433 RepID=UPI0021F5F80F|nr:odorant receptor 13a-like isoform X1 [Leptopilina boulardi]